MGIRMVLGWRGKAGALLFGCWLATGQAGTLQTAEARFGQHPASVPTRELAAQVLATHDHAGRPFAIVDKQQAQIYVFDAAGALRGASPVLLGQTRGDHSAPNVGEHAQAGKVPLSERTTPSGRFVSGPGRNLQGEHVVWVDYDSAFAIHRLRPGASREQREARLASRMASDNRASWGCVVVPVAFYENVVERLLGHVRGTVYVLPENGRLDLGINPL